MRPQKAHKRHRYPWERKEVSSEVPAGGFFYLQSGREHKEGANGPGQKSKKHIKSIE